MTAEEFIIYCFVSLYIVGILVMFTVLLDVIKTEIMVRRMKNGRKK